MAEWGLAPGCLAPRAHTLIWRHCSLLRGLSTGTSPVSCDQHYYLINCTIFGVGVPGGSDGKESACSVGDAGSILGSRRSPGGGHGSPLQYLAWRIPWTEEPGGLQSVGSQRVGHNPATKNSSNIFGAQKDLPCSCKPLTKSLIAKRESISFDVPRHFGLTGGLRSMGSHSRTGLSTRAPQAEYVSFGQYWRWPIGGSNRLFSSHGNLAPCKIWKAEAVSQHICCNCWRKPMLSESKLSLQKTCKCIFLLSGHLASTLPERRLKTCNGRDMEPRRFRVESFCPVCTHHNSLRAKIFHNLKHFNWSYLPNWIKCKLNNRSFESL